MDTAAPSGGAEKTAVSGPGFEILATLLYAPDVSPFAIGRG